MKAVYAPSRVWNQFAKPELQLYPQNEADQQVLRDLIDNHREALIGYGIEADSGKVLNVRVGLVDNTSR